MTGVETSSADAPAMPRHHEVCAYLESRGWSRFETGRSGWDELFQGYRRGDVTVFLPKMEDYGDYDLRMLMALSDVAKVEGRPKPWEQVRADVFDYAVKRQVREAEMDALAFAIDELEADRG